jgi:uncharacterized RDD family membrane protein YckC
MERQGFGIRLAAFLIDVVALILISIVLGLIFGLGFGVRFGGAAAQAGMGFALVSTLATLGYWSTEIFMAASPGKKLLGLRIGSETGEVAPQNQLITRWLIKNAANLIGLLAAIPGLGLIFGWLSIAAGLVIFIGCFLTLGQARQALHDMLAHTAVFKLTPAAGFPVTPMQAPPPPPAV